MQALLFCPDGPARPCYACMNTPCTDDTNCDEGYECRARPTVASGKGAVDAGRTIGQCISTTASTQIAANATAAGASGNDVGPDSDASKKDGGNDVGPDSDASKKDGGDGDDSKGKGKGPSTTIIIVAILAAMLVGIAVVVGVVKVKQMKYEKGTWH